MAEWRAVVARLDGFESSIRSAEKLAADPDSIHSVATPKREITLPQLLVKLPNGAPLVAADQFSLRPGERTLVTGPSGAGKSTLFRAIAGIWPFGEGTIEIPANAAVMMLPQRPYLPIGTLHAAIVYPGEAASVDADRVREVLKEVGLPRFAARSEEEAHWNHMLSLGEQQRLGLARALLHAPSYLFLDEATASLDEPSEAALYHHRIDRSSLDAGRPAPAQCRAGPRRRQVRVARRGQSRRVVLNGTRAKDLKPAPRPGLAAHPAVPGIGERGQQHRAGQHRRQQER